MVWEAYLHYWQYMLTAGLRNLLNTLWLGPDVSVPQSNSRPAREQLRQTTHP